MNTFHIQRCISYAYKQVENSTGPQGSPSTGTQPRANNLVLDDESPLAGLNANDEKAKHQRKPRATYISSASIPQGMWAMCT